MCRSWIAFEQSRGASEARGQPLATIKTTNGEEIGHAGARRTTFIVTPDGRIARTIGERLPRDSVLDALAAVRELAAAGNPFGSHCGALLTMRRMAYRCIILLGAGLSTSGLAATLSRDWPAVGGDAANTRYSSLSQVNVSNVQRLGAAWTTQLKDARSPIVVRDGRMFVTAGAAVHALDAGSGHILWKFQPQTAPATRGVAVGGGRVYAGLGNSDLVALDEKTGALLWTTRIGDADWRGVQLGQPPSGASRKAPPPALDPSAQQRIAAAPAYVDGKIIVGLANGDFGVRGRIVCLDAASGRRLWQFFTVPDPQEAGHESWPQDSDVWKTGGGGVWMNPAVDAALGLVYIGVGNPVPQWSGEIRAGDNLYTNSVVALNLGNGKLAWHFQLIHHDIWDGDLGVPLILFDTVLRGRLRQGLAVMRTDGYLFQLDRRTGKPLLPIVEREVPHDNRLLMSPTQPFPVGADALGPRCVEKDVAPAGFQRKCFFDVIGTDKNLMFPFRSTRVAPMSFSPQTGYFYATAGIQPLWMQRSDDPYYYGFVDAAPGTGNYGLIAAVDHRTGKIAWQKRMPYRIDNGSGTTSTAGGLLLHGEPDGQLQAYDGKTGKLLWSFQTGANVKGAIATYELAGEQYIAVAAGDVWAFKLDGALAQRPAPVPPPTVAKFTGPTVRRQTIDVGTTVFDVGVTGSHTMFDEFAFYPVRTRIERGARVTFTNTGNQTHTIQAKDGSWSTGPIAPGESKAIVAANSGQFVFVCAEHPWSTGELTVSNEPVDPQAQRGEALYRRNCAACHRENLAGREPAPPLAGDDFLAKWSGRPIADLYQLTRTTMPLGRPNSLTPQEYLDVVEFLLDTNDIRTASGELAPGAPRPMEPIPLTAH